MNLKKRTKFPLKLIRTDPLTREYQIKEPEQRKRRILFKKVYEGNEGAIRYLKRFYNITMLVLNGKTIIP